MSHNSSMRLVTRVASVIAIGAVIIIVPVSSEARTLYGCQTPSNWAGGSPAQFEAHVVDAKKLAANPGQIPKIAAQLSAWIDKARQKRDAKAEAVNSEGLAFVNCIHEGVAAGLDIDGTPLASQALFDTQLKATEQLKPKTEAKSKRAQTAPGSTTGSSGSSTKTVTANPSEQAIGSKITPINRETGRPCISGPTQKPEYCAAKSDPQTCTTEYHFQNSCDAQISITATSSSGKDAHAFCMPGKSCHTNCWRAGSSNTPVCPLTAYTSRF